METTYHSDVYCGTEVNLKIFTCDLLSVVQNVISGVASITPIPNNSNAWKIEGEKGKPVVTIQYEITPGNHLFQTLNADRNKQWDYVIEARDEPNSQVNNTTVLASHSAVSNICKPNSLATHQSSAENQSVATIIHEALTGNPLVVSDQNLSEKTAGPSNIGNIFDPKHPKKNTQCNPAVNSLNIGKTGGNRFSHSLTAKRGEKHSVQLSTRQDGAAPPGTVVSGHEDVWKAHVSATQSLCCKSATGSAPCKICDKSFSISFRAVQDEPHTGQRPFRCSYCPKRFIHGSTLITHERSHTVERPFACIYCTKTFTRKNVLEIHKRTHTGEKPYKCSYCAKTFSIKHHKVNHERSHTGEKPFSCAYCSKMFSRKSSLKQHESLHIRDNPLIPYGSSRSFNGT